ncbi:MAG: glycosyltransferase family 4 protein [Planctomycetes bacterium]|nr:glycosyltransferase family 4 protein [Planctomycetota bacterium]
MRLLVDLASCDNPDSGIGRRALALWPRVAGRLSARGGAVLLLAPPAWLERLDPGSEGLDAQAVPAFAGSPWRRHRRFNPELRRRARDWKADFTHQETLPLADPSRSIVTIHDLRELHPMWRGSRSRRIAAGLLYPMQIPRTALVVTVSEFMRSEITRLLRIGKDRIALVPNAVDEAWFQRGGHPDAEVLARYGLEPRQYLLHVGHREPRKNLGFAVDVLAELHRRGQPLTLVLAGRAKPGYRKPEQRARKLGLSDHLQILEDFADADLPALYRQARQVLLPSRYEGYGLTGPEARAAGTPVLANAIPPFPELLGAESCLPLDASQWADRVEAIVGRQPPEHAHQRPDWDDVAASFLDAMNAVLTSR